MPGAYHGIGTIYYGNREKADDGSFITTKWAIFVFVPLFPLGSYRVRPLDGKGFSLIGHRRRYPVEKVELNVRQVANTYLLCIGVFLLMILVALHIPTEWQKQILHRQD
jgi:hypothetical protein